MGKSWAPFEKHLPRQMAQTVGYERKVCCGCFFSLAWRKFGMEAVKGRRERDSACLYMQNSCNVAQGPNAVKCWRKARRLPWYILFFSLL